MCGILAITAGVIVIKLGVALYQGLFDILPLYLCDPKGFQRMAELSNLPEELKAAYQRRDNFTARYARRGDGWSLCHS